MKLSEAMLKGYEMVDGKQCKWTSKKRDRKGHVTAYCVSGAAMAGGFRGSFSGFRAIWGVHPVVLNDDDKLPWEHIYGMAVAAGL